MTATPINWPMVADFMERGKSEIVGSRANAELLASAIKAGGSNARIRVLAENQFVVRKGRKKTRVEEGPW